MVTVDFISSKTLTIPVYMVFTWPNLLSFISWCDTKHWLRCFSTCSNCYANIIII